MIFAKQAVLAIYVKSEDYTSSCFGSKESLFEKAVTVDVNVYNVNNDDAEASLHNTIASLKEYIVNIAPTRNISSYSHLSIFATSNCFPLSLNTNFSSFSGQFFVCHFENITVESIESYDRVITVDKKAWEKPQKVTVQSIESGAEVPDESRRDKRQKLAVAQSIESDKPVQSDEQFAKPLFTRNRSSVEREGSDMGDEDEAEKKMRVKMRVEELRLCEKFQKTPSIDIYGYEKLNEAQVEYYTTSLDVIVVVTEKHPSPNLKAWEDDPCLTQIWYKTATKGGFGFVCIDDDGNTSSCKSFRKINALNNVVIKSAFCVRHSSVSSAVTELVSNIQAFFNLKAEATTKKVFGRAADTLLRGIDRENYYFTSSTSTYVEHVQRPGFTCMGCVVTSSSGPDLYVKRSPLLSEDQKFWLVSYESFAAKSHTNFPISRSEKNKWYKLCIKTDNLESSNVVGKVSELVEKKYLQEMVMKYKNFFFLDSKIGDVVNYTQVDSTLLNEGQNLLFLDEIKAHVFYFKAEDATFSLAPLASKTRQAPQPPLTLCRDKTTYHLMAFVTAPSSKMKSASCSYYVRPWSQYNNFGNIEDISPFSFPERSIMNVTCSSICMLMYIPDSMIPRIEQSMLENSVS